MSIKYILECRHSFVYIFLVYFHYNSMSEWCVNRVYILNLRIFTNLYSFEKLLAWNKDIHILLWILHCIISSLTYNFMDINICHFWMILNQNTTILSLIFTFCFGTHFFHVNLLDLWACYYICSWEIAFYVVQKSHSCLYFVI